MPKIYQCVVPKAGDSAWNGNYVGSSPITLTISSITSVTVAHTVWGGGERVQFTRSGPKYNKFKSLV